jgi:hypothetical protein
MIFLCQVQPNFAGYLIHKNMKGKTKITIQGHLDTKWKNWFEGMVISYAGNNTILTGDIKDEAHLHGILNQIRDLNLKLISVNPTEE